MAAMLAVIFSVVAILPLFVGDIRFVMHILIMCLIWTVVASCWDVIMGFAGIFSFGQVAFFVIGAYASAILSVSLDIPPVYAMFLAAAITAGIGILIGLPCLRLAGPYVALLTFGIFMTLQPLLRGSIGLAIGSAGSRGLLTIPPIELFGFTFSSAELVPMFYFTLLLTIICSAVIVVVLKSYWGTAFLALKDSEEFAVSLGVSPIKYKLMVFALTSFLTGLIGGLYAHYVGVLSTRMVSLDILVMLMVMMVIGGIGQYPGVVLGAFITVTLNELLAPLGPYRLIAMGGMVVILVLLLPDGIMGVFRKLSFARLKTKKRSQ